MDLENVKNMQALDSQGMLGLIDNLPGQLEESFAFGNQQPLFEAKGIRQVVVAGMGGSGIGGALLSAYASSTCKAPITVWRDYNLPAWASGPETLVIASSYSGNTEETLSAFDTALERKTTTLVMSTGGKIAEKAQSLGIPLWKFVYKAQPRTAIGYTFALPLAAVSRLGLLVNPAKDVADAANAMREQSKLLQASVAVSANAAKKLAQRCAGKLVVVFGADSMAPVARRWKGQISEIGKAWSQFEELPELDHNSIAGTKFPKEIIDRTVVVFLQSAHDHPRNALRVKITQDIMSQQGFQTEVVHGAGPSLLSQMYTALHMGDYVAYYLSMLYEIDPSPVEVIEGLKKRLLAGA
jgi:glucose/mannose-6-phosphate isomerase